MTAVTEPKRSAIIASLAPKPYKSDLQFRDDAERADWLHLAAGAASQPNASTENILWFADDAIKGARERSAHLDKRTQPVWWLWRFADDVSSEGWRRGNPPNGLTHAACVKLAESLARPGSSDGGHYEVRLFDRDVPFAEQADKPLWWIWIPEGRTVTSAGWLEAEGAAAAPPTTHAKLYELRTNAALAGNRVFGEDRRWDSSLPTVVRTAPSATE